MVAVGSEHAPLRRRISLRLDDGTLISGCSKHTKSDAVAVVCLKPTEAYESGFLQEAELLRAQSLLCEVHAKLPEAGPLRSLSTGTKRSLDSVLEVGQAVSGKRSRSTGVVAPHNGYHDTAAVAPPAHVEKRLPAPPPPAPRPVTPAADAGVVSLGLGSISRIVKMLGKESFIFTDPVNGNLVTDYYDIIKNPICLNEIRAQLQQGGYPTMAAFYEDMYLLLSNCYTYNKIGTGIHILGQRIEKLFNAELRKAGHAHLIRNIKKQARAASRGAAQLEDDEDDYDYKPTGPPKRPGSQRQVVPATKAKSRQGGAPRPVNKVAAGPGGVARTKSVNSYMAFQPLPEDKAAQLAETLSNEDLLMEKMDGVVDILQRANELGNSEDGEVELDLTVLSPQTVWALYEYIFGPQPRPAAAEPVQRSGSGFQLEQDSDYDPEEDEDE